MRGLWCLAAAVSASRLGVSRRVAFTRTLDLKLLATTVPPLFAGRARGVLLVGGGERR